MIFSLIRTFILINLIATDVVNTHLVSIYSPKIMRLWRFSTFSLQAWIHGKCLSLENLTPEPLSLQDSTHFSLNFPQIYWKILGDTLKSEDSQVHFSQPQSFHQYLPLKSVSTEEEERQFCITQTDLTKSPWVRPTSMAGTNSRESRDLVPQQPQSERAQPSQRSSPFKLSKILFP